MVARNRRCRRSHEVRICRSGRSSMTCPSRSMATRFGTSTPRFLVPAPLASSASNNSGWPVMPAPRPTNSVAERSYTSTLQPIWRKNAAENSPDIDPPIIMARRLSRLADVMKRARLGSLGLDAGESDHLAPLVGLGGDQVAEIVGGAWKERRAKIDKPGFRCWIGEHRIDCSV